MAENGTVAYVTEMPQCDIHKYYNRETGVPATHDVRTKTGAWANVCDDHRATHAMHPNKLGIGIGQKLKLYKDRPESDKGKKHQVGIHR